MPSRKQPAHDARSVAWAVLDEHRRTGRFLAPLLDEHAAEARLSFVDRRLAVELAHGMLRRRSTLDAILAPHVRRSKEEVEERLWTLLQLGAYQLVLLDSIPQHAAVHETVSLARKSGKPRWTGFVNGVLRNVARTVTNEFADCPAADAVPLATEFVGRISDPSAMERHPPAEDRAGTVRERPDRGEPCENNRFLTVAAPSRIGSSTCRHRRMTNPVFPDPSVDPAGYFAAAFSFPPWMVKRWIERYPFERLLSLGFRFDSPPPIVLRVNRLRTTRKAFLEALDDAGIAAVSGNHPAAVRLLAAAKIDALPGYAEGRFVVQDETAMAVCDLLAPQPGETVLDLCAAPGTKTTYLAESMDDAGTIVAADVSADRLKLVEDNVRRLALSRVTTRHISRDGGDIPAGPFDAILVDAPCSNTGVLGRRPEARWRISPEDLRQLPALQARLLRDALSRLTPGGRAVYATCSIEPEENGHVVRAALADFEDCELVEETTAFPGDPADGGYRALIRRSA